MLWWWQDLLQPANKSSRSKDSTNKSAQFSILHNIKNLVWRRRRPIPGTLSTKIQQTKWTDFCQHWRQKNCAVAVRKNPACNNKQCVMASNTFIKLIILYFQEEKCLSNHFPPKIHRRPAPTSPKQSLKLTARMRITLSCEKFPSQRPRQSANSASDLPRLEVRFTTQTLSVSYLLCLFYFQSSDSSLKLGPLYEFGYCVAHLYCLMFR